MTTQPDVAALWQVTVDNLQAHEPAGSLASTMIVDGSMPFELSATVDGTVNGAGIFWLWAEFLGVGFTVDYYAERFGAEPGEADLGQVNVTMSPGGGPYGYTSASSTKLDVPANTLQPGVYRIMCMARWFTGITAFPNPAVELLIEVY